MKHWFGRSKNTNPKALRKELIRVEGDKNPWDKVVKAKQWGYAQFPQGNLWASATFILIRPNAPNANGEWQPFDQWREYIRLHQIHVENHKNLFLLIEKLRPEHKMGGNVMHLIQCYNDLQKALNRLQSKEVNTFLKEIRPQ